MCCMLFFVYASLKYLIYLSLIVTRVDPTHKPCAQKPLACKPLTSYSRVKVNPNIPPFKLDQGISLDLTPLKFYNSGTEESRMPPITLEFTRGIYASLGLTSICPLHLHQNPFPFFFSFYCCYYIRYFFDQHLQMPLFSCLAIAHSLATLSLFFYTCIETYY